MIIHNARFDCGFLDNELELLGKSETISDICTVTDSLIIARQKFPKQPNSLDALMNRFTIKQFSRNTHGALLDVQILAQVNLAMMKY